MLEEMPWSSMLVDVERIEEKYLGKLVLALSLPLTAMTWSHLTESSSGQRVEGWGPHMMDEKRTPTCLSQERPKEWHDGQTG